MRMSARCPRSVRGQSGQRVVFTLMRAVALKKNLPGAGLTAVCLQTPIVLLLVLPPWSFTVSVLSCSVWLELSSCCRPAAFALARHGPRV